ncbi:MAG TPA: pyridoxal phosphate-dependent aminotransferase [Acidobacteriota bacterium]|nr:pyridoxal phosphate-dependent aminotransferase [Acidobacteriota bacterium]
MLSRLAGKLYGEADDRNNLYRLRDELKAAGHEIVDLISGNINEQGFCFPQNLIEEILVSASRRCSVYRPDSFGQPAAREAVSGYYSRQGVTLDPGSILITPGTSLSYWYCFKLLADEGDEILCPCPSYPLFDYIAMMSGVKLVHYPLLETDNWRIDLEKLETLVSAKTRAVVLISPHNPTGHVSSTEEIDGLAGIARRHELAVISDEVFGDFLMARDPLPRPVGSGAPLVFTLNGFSKMLALPGMKFGWMAVSGDPGRVGKALRSLELMSDTFLPVNEIVQAAAPDFFQLGNAVRFELGHRVRQSWMLAEMFLAEESPHWSCVKPRGGFYVTLRLHEADEEQAAERILREHHVLVHPGYFYDMAARHLVFCFAQKPELLEDAIPKILRTIS